EVGVGQHADDAGDAVHDVFYGKRDELFDLLGRQALGFGIDFNLHRRDIWKGVDVELVKRQDAAAGDQQRDHRHQQALAIEESDKIIRHDQTIPPGRRGSLLFGLALLQQQVIPFYDDAVAGFEPVADLDPVAALYSRTDRPLFIAVAGNDKDDRLSGIVEHGRLRNRDRAAARVRDDLHIGEHVGLQAGVVVRHFGADPDGAGVRIDDAGHQD